MKPLLTPGVESPAHQAEVCDAARQKAPALVGVVVAVGGMLTFMSPSAPPPERATDPPSSVVAPGPKSEAAANVPSPTAKEIEEAPERQTEPSVTLLSDPTGAEVWRGEERVGTTPMQVTWRPQDSPPNLKLVLEDREASLTLKPEQAGQSVSVILPPAPRVPAQGVDPAKGSLPAGEAEGDQEMAQPAGSLTPGDEKGTERDKRLPSKAKSKKSSSSRKKNRKRPKETGGDDGFEMLD